MAEDAAGGDPVVKLRALAHSRTGDKGNISNISLVAFDAADYPRLVRHVTAARVQALFAGIVRGEVVRYELPLIGALNFVLHGALGGGVTRSLALDPHGKSLSSALLDLDVPHDHEPDHENDHEGPEAKIATEDAQP